MAVDPYSGWYDTYDNITFMRSTINKIIVMCITIVQPVNFHNQGQRKSWPHLLIWS